MRFQVIIIWHIAATTLAFVTMAEVRQHVTSEKVEFTIPHPVRITGQTNDGKYPTYDLEGDLEDLNYSSSDNVIYQPDDLPPRMDFIDPQDVDAGVYFCKFVCKDTEGRVVGLNPAWEKLYSKKLTH